MTRWITGMFMIRLGSWKYVHYPGFAPQLFNLADDPEERIDLGTSGVHVEIRQRCEGALRTVVDPDEVNTRAFAEQAEKVAALGALKRSSRRGTSTTAAATHRFRPKHRISRCSAHCCSCNRRCEVMRRRAALPCTRDCSHTMLQQRT